MPGSNAKDGVSRFRLALASDTMIRANQSGLGTSSDGNTYTTTGVAMTWAIASNEATATGITGNAFALLGSGTLINADALVRVSISASNDAPAIILRYIDTSNYYRIRLTSGTHIAIAKVVSNSSTTIGTFNATISTNTFYWLRARIVGTVLYAKVWAASGSEPAAWSGSVVDSALTAAGQYGLQVNLSASGDTTKFDHFSVTNAYTSDIVTRFGLQSGTTYHDGLARFGLSSGATSRVMDALSRFRIQSGVLNHDALSRFRLLAAKSLDSLSRFRLQSGVIAHDALSRFRVQSPLQNKDALGRFRQQSGTTYHDTSTRFKLGSVNQKALDGLARFRLLATKSVDALGRFRLQSGILYHDALSRFRQQSGTINHDVNSRFRLLVPLARDSIARFRQQASASRDTETRFRLQQSALLNTIMRMRLQSSVQLRDAQTRYRLQSGVVRRDAVSRYRLLSIASLSVIMRFCQVALASKNAQFRFCLFGNALARDAVSRFGLALAPNVTFYVRSGSVLFNVRKGDIAFYVPSGNALMEVRGT